MPFMSGERLFLRAFAALAAAGGLAFAAPALAFAETAATTPANTSQRLQFPATPDVFGTIALKAGATSYDSRFRRASAADLADPLVLQLAAEASGLDPVTQLKIVQQSVNRRVRWAHDPNGVGMADFWATAGETLRRGTGDSADIAIAKMQVLKAAGFDPRRLYISIGSHRARGAHILLLAKIANSYFVLEDNGDRVETPAHHRLFEPVITLSEGRSWLHGRRVGTRLVNASLPRRKKR